MFYEPSEGVEFTESGQLVETMDLVRNFSFKHGLLGPAAPSPDVIGIEFPSGKVLGDEGNVNLRFSSKYMQMAADGEL
jgi:NitT/TauT family transport system substrate-binding protein